MNIRKKFSAQYIMISIFVCFICFSMITGFIFQFIKLKEYKSEIVSINNQIDETRAEIKKLKKVNGSKDLEDLARERLNMVKPDETVYIDIGKRGN